MKVKRLLRFYFFADSLERALDNLILKYAYTSGGKEGERCAQILCELIGEKDKLNGLWLYLDAVASSLSEEEREILRGYASMRCGIKRVGQDRQRAIKRSVIKFTRRAKRLCSFKEEIEIVGKYYCVISTY